ncbi:MAG: acetylornithine/succinylornithine family transaminase [Anaerovorax sp.]
MKSKDVKEQDQHYIVGTYGRNDLCIVKGQGSTCYSAEGDEYIDFSSGIGVNSLGFANHEWVEAITKQAGTMQHISNLFYTAPCAELAEGMIKKSAMEKVFFANSGAEANEGAIKTARKYSYKKYGPDRYEIITLVNSFHGRTMAAITATGQEAYHKDFYPFVDGFLYAKANDLADVRKKITKRTCGIMMELVQGEGGVVVLDQQFVAGVADICKEQDILLIIDEVQTGVGRTGTFLACEQFGLEPDLVTVAKGLGGGLPIGGILFGKKTADVLQPGDHGTTFGGNPVVCAGGILVLNKMDEHFLEEVSQKGFYIKKKLEDMPGVAGVSGLGLMLGVALSGEKTAKEVVAEAMEKGLILLTAKEKVRLLPPLNISREEIDKGLHILEAVLNNEK